MKTSEDFYILMPVETVSRELDYKLYLSVILAKKGFKVYLGKKNEIYTLFQNLNSNFAYIDKGFHENVSVEKIYKVIKKNSGMLFHLDEEGAIDFKDYPNIKRRYSKDVFEYCDKIFLWGNHQKKILQQSVYFDKDKVLVTGHPRFEMLKSSLLNIHINKSNEIKRKFGKFILFNSNTKYANHIHGEDFLHKNYGNRIKNLSERITYDKIKLKNNIELIKAILDKTDFDIVIRPHPEENINYYKELFDNSRVHCVYDESAIPWIMSSVYTIHNDCTTAIESRLLGKKPIAYIKNYDQELSPFLPLEVSEMFSNLDQIINYISSEKDILFEIPAIINDFFSTQLDSTEIISKEIYNYVEKNFKKNNFISLGIKYRMISFLKIFFHKIFNYSGYKNNLLSKNKLSGIDNYKFIESKLNSVLKYSSKDNRVILKSKRPGLYQISF
tara:strand:+ start:2002 stop:3327 length:1326 start_codon:yes stop_codon:yes gene_type:complete